MKHGSLFSGIGGFDLAAEWMEWENVFHCEWNDFGKRVLSHYWPKAISYEDITKTDFTIHRGGIDIISGGFPCQPYSQAGKRLGKEDERHLWPEMLRAIREVRPRWVVGENVRGLVNWSGGLVFDEVQADLEAEGYEVLPYVLPAASVNAPHRRDRVWFVAYSDFGNDGRASRQDAGEEEKERVQEWDAIRKLVKSSEILGDASDTNKRSAGSPRTSGKAESNGSKNNDEQGSRGKQTEQHIGCSNVLRDATNATSTSGRRQHEQRQEQGQFRRRNSEGTTSDSMRSGGGQDKRQGESRQPNETGAEYDWADFPTQSPICGGDDGLPAELDGITFPKWRNESIKAYGNAVVPQVVYEIFKAIERFELYSE
jgi:DNA (cytosine-5)-methyltransferase 1